MRGEIEVSNIDKKRAIAEGIMKMSDKYGFPTMPKKKKKKKGKTEE